jgi:hypothetical protein
MTRRRTIIELSEVSVDPPLVDRAHAWIHRVGVFSKLTGALEWMSGRNGERGPREPSGLLYYRADLILLDVELHVAYTMVFSGADRRRGIISGDTEKPWGGRRSEDCRHKPGDLVGFISNYEPVYRVGVILRQPPTPELGRQGGLTRSDDTYLVGTLDDDGSPECTDHDHIAQPLLFPVEHEVPPEVMAALMKRHRGYVG